MTQPPLVTSPTRLCSRSLFVSVLGVAFVVALLALLPVARLAPHAAAQAATPTATAPRLTHLGYPEMRFVATDDGFTGPATAVAGRALVVLENRGSPDGPAADSDISFIQLPAGVTLEEFNLGPVDGVIPDWFNDLISVGGIHVAAGNTGHAVIDFTPGEWYVGVGETAAGEANPFQLLTITGDAATPAETDDPRADVVIDLADGAINLPAQLPAGPQVWHVINSGAALHEMLLVKTPELLSFDQLVTVMTLPEGATPPPGVPDPASLEFPVDALPTMSAGHEIWFEIDLTAGAYATYCAVGDTATGAPHAFSGEVAMFTAGEAATITDINR